MRESVHVSVSMHVSERGSERSQCLHVSSSTPPSLQTHTYTLACMHYAYMCINQVFGATDGFGKGNVLAKGMYLHTHTHTHTHIHAYACACMQKQGFRCNGWSRHKASRWCARQRSMLLETARYSSTCRYLNPEPEMSLATARCFSTCRCLNPKPKPWQLLDAPQCAGA